MCGGREGERRDCLYKHHLGGRERERTVFLNVSGSITRPFPKAAEKTSQVFMDGFPVEGAEVGSDYHQHHLERLIFSVALGN